MRIARFAETSEYRNTSEGLHVSQDGSQFLAGGVVPITDERVLRMALAGELSWESPEVERWAYERLGLVTSTRPTASKSVSGDGERPAKRGGDSRNSDKHELETPRVDKRRAAKRLALLTAVWALSPAVLVEVPMYLDVPAIDTPPWRSLFVLAGGIWLFLFPALLLIPLVATLVTPRQNWRLRRLLVGVVSGGLLVAIVPLLTLHARTFVIDALEPLEVRQESDLPNLAASVGRDNFSARYALGECEPVETTLDSLRVYALPDLDAALPVSDMRLGGHRVVFEVKATFVRSATYQVPAAQARTLWESRSARASVLSGLGLEQVKEAGSGSQRNAGAGSDSLYGTGVHEGEEFAWSVRLVGGRDDPESAEVTIWRE